MERASKSADPRLDRIVQRLVREFQPQRIYLFGSRARGDDGADSDYDLMVIVDRRDQPMHRLARRAHALMWDLGASADILVWSRDEFDGRAHLRASLPAAVLNQGKLLHAA